jgi:hypothetical protein
MRQRHEEAILRNTMILSTLRVSVIGSCLVATLFGASFFSENGSGL